jgi:Tfp pilus assembly protein PilV
MGERPRLQRAPRCAAGGPTALSRAAGGLRALSRAAARLRSDEAGFGLIEVLVSALLVVLVSSGVYLGLDAASATSGINKHRSVATYVAQQDQDRMRAMAVTELSNYRATSSQTVGGVTYTIASAASWITDGTGAASCTSAGAQANYLRISSTVTWPGMTIKPVSIESIVAPPSGSFGTNQGSLAVQVRDRNGAGVPGASVSLSGPQSYADTTNDRGCVLWGYLPVGTYTVALSKSGFVDPQGVAQPSKQVGVVGEATTTLAFDYDAGGQAQAVYQTLTAAGGTPIAANGTSFTLVTSHQPVPLGPYGDGQPHATFPSSPVFPYSDPYSAYAGSCAGADPNAYGQPQQFVTVVPGGLANVTLREPPVDVRVLLGSTPEAGATVKLTATGTGCSAVATRTTGSDGYLTDRALPYGPYTVCVQDAAGRKKTGSVSNTTASGVPVGSATFDMTGAPAGTCP